MKTLQMNIYLFVGMLFSIVLVISSSSRAIDPQQNSIALLTDLVVTEHIIQDLSCVALGARRVAGDLVYIQLLQYYGISVHLHHHGDEEHEPTYEELVARKTKFDPTFPRLKEFGYRILRLNPSFSGAILEVAGSLAFNENRIDESLKLLKEAIDRNPGFYRYEMYVAAILYKNSGRDAELIQKLDEATQYPDCPNLLRNVLANLYKKFGENEKAADIYIKMIHRNQNPADTNHARNQLKKLLMQYPNLAQRLDLSGL